MSLYLYNVNKGQKEKFSFSLREELLLGNADQLVLGQSDNCSKRIRIKIPRELKVNQVEGIEGGCFLSGQAIGSSSVTIFDESEASRSSFEPIESFLKNSKGSKSTSVKDLEQKILSTSNLFGKLHFLARFVDQDFGYFESPDKFILSSLYYLSFSFRFGRSGVVKFQDLQNGNVLLKFNSKNKNEREYLVYKGRNVYRFVFYQFAQNLNYPESFLKSIFLDSESIQSL